MKRYFVIVGTVIGLLVLTMAGFAQSQAERTAATAAAMDRFVVSAEAGGVNYIEGTVTISRIGGRSGPLLERDKVEAGDTVRTGSDGRVELLLNPGSYLRLGADSEMRFVSTSLDDLEVRLDRGIGIFEVYASREFKVSVRLPGRGVELVRSGVYRFDVTAGRLNAVSVYSGTAKVDGILEPVIGGQEARFDSGRPVIGKFDRDRKDDLYAWSKARGKELAKAVASLKNRKVNDALIAAYNAGTWNFFDSVGVWVFDPRVNRWYFLPYGRGWRTPFGYSLSNGLWWYNDIPWWYSNPTWYPPNSGGSGGSGGTGGTGGGGQVTPLATAGDRSPVPPFVRMEQTGSSGGNIFGGGRGITNTNSPSSSYGSSEGTRSSVPVYTPPPSPPPPPPPSSSDTGAKSGKGP